MATGRFELLQRAIGGVTDDRRLQLLLIAFSFGAFFEGASGFGTPVAITGAILIGLGFSPLAASGLSLIANTAPVAYGALGTPIQGLASVTGLDPYMLGAMVGRQLPVFSLIVPFWVIWAFAGWRGMKDDLAGHSGHRRFVRDPAIRDLELHQSVDRRYRRLADLDGLPDPVPEGVAAEAALAVAGAARPGRIGGDHDARRSRMDTTPLTQAQLWSALLPWIIVCVVMLIWGNGAFKTWANSIFTWNYPVPDLHNMINKVPPVAAKPTPEGRGVRVHLPVVHRHRHADRRDHFRLPDGLLAGQDDRRIWPHHQAVRDFADHDLGDAGDRHADAAVGVDATLGLAFAATGVLYPFFGTLLGWLGVALTGSDTASNVLFGNLQKITSEQLGLSPILMAAANSSGGVMGKMIDAQSIVVASTATNWYGHEGTILRFVFLHSIVLACLVGLLVMLQAYVYPFTVMVLK